MIGTMRLFARSVVCVAIVVISACGGGGGTASAPPPSPPPTPTLSTADEGTPQNPVPIAIGSVRPSTVEIYDSYYTFVAPVTGTYKITLESPTVDVAWELYPDTSYSSNNMLGSCDSAWTAATESCTVNLLAGTAYYLQVSNWDWSSGAFGLNVTLLGDEGSTTSPVTLEVDIAHDGSVAMSGASYYQFTTNAASAYSVAISNPTTGSTTVKIFATPFDTNPLQTCSTWDRPVCTVNGLPAATPYFVQVVGNGTTAVGYTITVTQGVSQGSMAHPVVLTVDAASAHAGAVDGSSASYYAFTTASSGEYLLNMSAPYGVSAMVYSNTDFTNGYVSSCALAQCRLNGLNAYTPYYIEVGNTTTSDQTYLIAVNRGLTEGSVTEPIPVSVGVPHSANINSSGVAYYSFQTTDFAGSYTIGLAGTQTDLKWQLYSSLSAYTPISLCDDFSTQQDESCPSLNLEPNTTYYLAVTNKSSIAAGAYTLNIAAGGGSQGTITHPIDLGVVSAGGLTYSSGQIKNSGQAYFLDYGQSYYTFTTGPDSAVHVISLLGLQSDLQWDLSIYPTFGSSFQTCDAYTDTTPETCSTQGASPAMLEANTTYYLRVFNNANIISTFNLSLTPLLPGAGCTGTYNECIDFESGIPAGFTQSSTQAGTKWQWKADATTSAGPGTSSIVSGTVDYPYSGCFSYTPAVRPGSVTFSFLTQDEYLYLYVSDATTQLSINFDYTLGAWQRNTHVLPSGTGPLTFKWCLQRTSTTSTPVIWVDDIEFQ